MKIPLLSQRSTGKAHPYQKKIMGLIAVNIQTDAAAIIRVEELSYGLFYSRLINTLKKSIWIGLMLGTSIGAASAQQKVKDGSVSGSNLPNKDAILELESANKGLLHARVALKLTSDAFPLSAHVAGMMVYNTATANDVVPGIYYNDGTKWVLAKSTSGNLHALNMAGSGTPGIPGEPGGPPEGVVIVINDSGTYLFDSTSKTWTNIKGTAGKDGTSVTNGTGTPGAGTGANGDTYIDNSTGDIYTKQGNAWIKTGNIIGPKGDAGVAGSQGPVGPAGSSGLDGKSAYEVWLITHPGKTETEYLASLKGDTGAQGPAGAVGSPGLNGTDGKSAYEVWLITHPGKTETEYLASLKGDTGAQGPAGPIGAAGNDGTNGVDGKSAYEVWLVTHPGKTEVEYLASLKGDTGAQGVAGSPGLNGTDGKSAYEVWLITHPGKTETEYLASLKGDTGAQGPAGATGSPGLNGTDGKSAYEVWLVTHPGKTEAEYLASLKGDTGAQGPAGAAGSPGLNGTDGKSAYEVWLITHPGKTETEYLASLKGDTGAQGPAGATGSPGLNGTDGKSAYEVWLVTHPGKTEAEYLASLKGDTGVQGPAGPIGPQGDPGPWGPAGPAGPAGPPGMDGSDGVNGKNGLNGLNGQSAYELWLVTNPGGTEADFLASLKGAPGAKGAPGTPGAQGGIGLIVDGTNTTVAGTGTTADPYKINVAAEPWNVQGGTTPATTNAQNIYQTGSIAIGKNAVQNGASLDVEGAVRGGTNMVLGTPAGAVGANSVAFGEGNTASGQSSASWGANNKATELYATAFGWFNNASAYTSTAFGDSNNAAGLNSTAWGSYNNTDAGATYATVFGNRNTALAPSTTVFGVQNVAGSLNEVIFGRNAAIKQGNASMFVDTDPLLQIGNGSSDAVRNNALTLLKNGYMGIGIDGAATIAKPTERLDIGSGNLKIREININTGTATDKMVVADPAGILKTIDQPVMNNIYNSDGIINQDRIITMKDNAAALSLVGDGTAAGTYISFKGAGQTIASESDPMLPATLRLDAGGSYLETVVYKGNSALIASGTSADPLPLTISTKGSSVIRFDTNDTQRAVITEDGKVGIGTSYPDALLSVDGDATKTGSTAWGTFSDSRMKKNITPYAKGLKEILQINTVNFQYNGKGGYKDDGKRYVGVLAQEIEKILPGTVSQIKTADFADQRRYDPSELTYTLINAIKEQQKEIEAKNKEVEALKKSQQQLSERLAKLEKLLLDNKK